MNISERTKESQRVNTNSYADNFNRLIDNVNSTLQALSALNELTTTNASYVSVDIDQVDGNKNQIILPSYQTVLNELASIKSSIDSLITGYGNVKTADGTDRLLTVTPVPQAPAPISRLENPYQFSIDNNWFFEDLMFPRLRVNFDLTGQVESSADRVKVTRIILDHSVAANRNFYKNEILSSDKSVTYTGLKTLLRENNIKFFEDTQDVEFPLTEIKYIGTFSIENTRIIEGRVWYYLSTLNYAEIAGDSIYNNLTLKKSENDTNPTLIKFDETLYRVDDVVESEKRIRVTPYLGADVPGIEDKFTIYNDPFKVKEVSVNIGYNEIDFIFFKAVNEYYNIISPEWSTAVHFVTNDLTFVDDKNMPLSAFYYKYVADFGSKWIAEIKDRKVYAYNGITPNVPIIKPDFFSVVQINTQLNAALSNDDIKSTSANVESLKSTITSLKETLGLLKIDLQTAQSTEKHTQIQNKININTTKLNHAESEYRSSLKYLQDLAKGSGLLDVKPKYRIRGFFPIPESQFVQDNASNNLTEQKIIGFDVLYRYLKLDNTGPELKTFSYSEENINNIGVYSDWQEYTTGVLQKVWSEERDQFIWQEESIADGKVRNINQLDIPIQRGENVEIKIRSISEAGYPENPLKSNWSDSIIVEFPPELSTESEIATLLRDSLDSQTDLQIDEALKSLGVPMHLDDQVKNLTLGDSSFYKHKSDNIAIEYRGTDGSVYTVPVSTLLESILTVLFDPKDPAAVERQNTVEQVLKLRGYLKK